MNAPFHRPGISDGDSRWDLLGGCPTPGSPEAIDDAAASMRTRAEAAEDLYDQLQQLGLDLGDSGWGGPTAAAFAERFSALPARVLTARIALDAVSKALARWGEALHALRIDGLRALVDAEAAHAAWAAANDARTEAYQQGQLELHHDAAVGEAMRDLEAARARAAELRTDHAELAASATRIIDDQTPHAAGPDDDLLTAMLDHLGGPDLVAAVLGTGLDADGDGDGDGDGDTIDPAGEIAGIVADSWSDVVLGLQGALEDVMGAAVMGPARTEAYLHGEETTASTADIMHLAVDVGEDGTLPPATLPPLEGLVDLVPTVPTVVSVPLDLLAGLQVTTVDIPRPLRYVDWFAAVEASPAALTPSWLDLVDLQAVAGTAVTRAGDAVALSGGVPVVGTFDAEAQR